MSDSATRSGSADHPDSAAVTHSAPESPRLSAKDRNGLIVSAYPSHQPRQKIPKLRLVYFCHLSLAVLQTTLANIAAKPGCGIIYVKRCYARPVNRTEAIEILRRHQPLPPDSTLSEDVLRDFDAARRYFVANPDREAVPLLLGAIGDGSGFGVYQLIEDAIRPLPSSAVLPHVIVALQSTRAAARSWAAEIASSFPDPCLIPFLTPMLFSPDEDCRASAATALRFIPSQEVPTLLREAYARTRDPVLQEVLDEL